jgi:hypothetical protein
LATTTTLTLRNVPHNNTYAYIKRERERKRERVVVVAAAAVVVAIVPVLPPLLLLAALVSYVYISLYLSSTNLLQASAYYI